MSENRKQTHLSGLFPSEINSTVIYSQPKLRINNILCEKYSIKSLTDYFMKQWVNSAIKFWRVFDTPNGYSSTNNPLERYNRKI